MSALIPLQPLYVIEEELTALLDSVDVCEEDLQPELQARIAVYLAAEATKVDNICHVLAMLEYAQKNRKDEMARLAEEAKTAARAQERLEGYVCRVIQARGIKKLEGRTSSLSLRPSDGVIVTDVDSVPDAYAAVTVTMPAALWNRLKAEFAEDAAKLFPALKVDKLAVKSALKGGQDVPGCDLEYRVNLVRR